MEIWDAKAEGKIIFLGLLGLPILPLTWLVAGLTEPREIVEAYMIYISVFFLAGAFIPLILGLRAYKVNRPEWWIPHPG